MSPLQNCYSVLEVEDDSNPGLVRKQSRFEPYREFIDCFEGQSV